VPIGQPACAAIERYLTQERGGLVRKGTGNEIFLSCNGARLTAQRAWQIIKEIAALADCATNVYPHIFRSSFATHLLQGGADIRVIQECLGHADISTTQVYLAMDTSRLGALVRKCHPRGTTNLIQST
jgi:integrase/recombinase XerD